MIAKCIAVLAIVAQINASLCGCGSSSVVLPSSGCSSQSAVLAGSGATSRNIVARGKYPVALSNCGSMPCQQIPITTSRITAPVQEKPVVRLSSNIPAPRTVCHTCTCYKTIVRPRVHQQIITVPTVQRYIETLHKPVIENVQYEAVPVNCGGVASSSSGLISVGAGSVCQSPVQAIQVPSCGVSCAQQVQVPVVQAVSSPCVQQVQAVSSPCVQQVQAVSSPCVQQVQAVSSPCVQQVQAVSSPCVQQVQVPVYQSSIVPASCGQRIEIPQTISMGCSSPCSC